MFPDSGISVSASNRCPEHHEYPIHRWIGTKFQSTENDSTHTIYHATLYQASEHGKWQYATRELLQASLICLFGKDGKLDEGQKVAARLGEKEPC
jgi:hypothetical protein